jgi:hypothetical protein
LRGASDLKILLNKLAAWGNRICSELARENLRVADCGRGAEIPMRFQKSVQTGLAIVTMGMLSVPAMADDSRRGAKNRSIQSVSQEQTSEQDKSACMPDVFRLCSRHIPDVDSIVACLEYQKPNLSAACRVVFNTPR